MNDYYDDAPAQQKSGSVLPWILLTVVIVFAGVGVVMMKAQMDTAVGAVDRMKTELGELRKRNEGNEEKRQELEKQVAQLTTDRDQLDKDKLDLTRQVKDLSDQLAVAKAAAVDPGNKRGKKGAALAAKGKHRR